MSDYYDHFDDGMISAADAWDGERTAELFFQARLKRNAGNVRKFKEKPQAGKLICTCDQCGSEFVAREADRKRGWARFCSKSCKAFNQAVLAGRK